MSSVFSRLFGRSVLVHHFSKTERHARRGHTLKSGSAVAQVPARHSNAASKFAVAAGLCAALFAGVTAPTAAQAQAWSNPTLTYTLPLDRRCLVGPNANAIIHEVYVTFGATLASGSVSGALNLWRWTENFSAASAASFFIAGGPGPASSTTTALFTSNDLVGGTDVYVGIEDNGKGWATGDAWSSTRSPTLSPDVSGPNANGIQQYTRIDLSQDPDCLNNLPTATAGPDQTVSSGSLVQLDGTGSSSNDVGESLSYSWASSTNGGFTAVTVINATSATPTFTAPVIAPGGANQRMRLTLTVTDASHEERDTVFITVQAPPGVPEIDVTGNAQSIVDGDVTPTVTDHTDFGSVVAASSTQFVDRTFTISNSGSGALSITSAALSGVDQAQFSITAAPAATVAASGQTTVTVRYNPQATGTHNATLTILNDDANEGTYDFALRGTGTNTTPTSNAGVDQTVASGASVTLDGSGSSDPDAGQTLGYTWAQTAGTSVTLTGGTTSAPTFTAPTLTAGAADVVLTFRLTFDDGITSAADTVSITVQAPIAPNLEIRGNGNVIAAGETSHSPAAGTNFGSVIMASPSAPATQVFTLHNTGTAPLAISGTSVTGPGAAQFTVSSPPPATIAAGAQASMTVSFLATALNFSSGHINVLSNDPDAATYSFAVTGLAVNTLPTPVPGFPQTVTSGALVTLDGSGSSANDTGQTLTYTWAETSAHGVVLSDVNAVAPTFTAPTLAVGAADITVSLQLTVNDGVQSNASTVVITVNAPVPEISITGNGQAIVDNANATSAANGTDFGSVIALNGDSQDITYTISNSGTGPLTVSNYLISQTAGSGFSFVGAGPGTIAAGGTGTFTVRFAPTVPSPSGGRIIVTNNDSDEGSYDFVIGGTGTNTAAVSNAGPDQTVASGAAVTLTGAASSDVDTGQTLTYRWIQVTPSPTVTLSDINAVSPTFTAPTLAPGSADVVLEFELAVTDPFAGSGDRVSITIQAPAAVPEIDITGNGQSIVDGDVTPATADHTDFGSVVALSSSQFVDRTFTISNSGSGALSITSAALSGVDQAQFSITAAPAATVAASGQTTVTVRYNPQATGTHNATLTILNDDADEGTYDFALRGTGTNTTPTANAGVDQTVASGASVTLDGSASSDPDAGQLLGYAWIQTSGTSVTLTGEFTSAPSFTAPTLIAGAADQVLTFSLYVTDGPGLDIDTVQITVTAPTNTAPTANAGPDQTVASGASVTLDGSGSSDSDAGQTLGYAWAQTAGTGVTLTGGTTSAPTFTAPTLIAGAADDILTFQLTFDDGITSATDTVQITVQAPTNTAPTANAGVDQTVASGASVTLDGSASSDPDAGQTLGYAWAQTAGTGVTLTGGTTSAPTFTAPTLIAGAADDILTFQLTFTDGITSATDTVQITVTAPTNTAPTANAGVDQTVASGASVTLDGSASSDPDAGQTLGYAWVQTSGTSVTLTGGTTSAPTFTAPTLIAGAADDILTFQLTFDDGITSATDTVQITVQAPADTTPPTVALTGAPQSVRSGDSFPLTITFSEPVIGFVQSDVTVVNGQLLALSGSGATYTATIMASGTGDLGVAIASSVATDGAGNPNTGSGIAVVADTTVDTTQEQMAGFMQSRASRLMGQQPDLIGLYRQQGSGALSVQATRGQGSLSFSTRPDSPVWAQLSASWSQSGTTQDRYAHLAIGRHIALTPSLSFGGMLQLDHIGFRDGLASITGNGWLAGPYLVGSHPEHPLYFSARALVGQTWNQHSPLGTYTNSVTTRRALFGVTVAGDVPWRTATLTPSLQASYTTDRQASYTDALNNLIPAQSVSMADLTLGIDASVPIEMQRGSLTLRGGLSLVYSQSTSTGAAALVVPATEGGRGSLRLGLDYVSDAGGEWGLDLKYDGLGTPNYGSYQLNLGYQRRF